MLVRPPARPPCLARVPPDPHGRVLDRKSARTEDASARARERHMPCDASECRPALQVESSVRRREVWLRLCACDQGSLVAKTALLGDREQLGGKAFDGQQEAAECVLAVLQHL